MSTSEVKPRLRKRGTSHRKRSNNKKGKHAAHDNTAKKHRQTSSGDDVRKRKVKRSKSREKRANTAHTLDSLNEDTAHLSPSSKSPPSSDEDVYAETSLSKKRRKSSHKLDKTAHTRSRDHLGASGDQGSFSPKESRRKKYHSKSASMSLKEMSGKYTPTLSHKGSHKGLTKSSSLKRQKPKPGKVKKSIQVEDAMLQEFVSLEHGNIHQDADVLVESFVASFKAINNGLQKPNVLVVGIAGAGKSSLINKIFGESLAEVGAGRPITQHFTKYSCKEMNVVIYDSRGLEHGFHEEFIDDTLEFFEQHSISQTGDSKDAIHVIWYIINTAHSRFEPFEEKICKELFTMAPLMFLLNKADISSEEDRENLKQIIVEADLPNMIGMYDTVSHPQPRLREVTRCPKCNSDDITIRKKTRSAQCENCGFKYDLSMPNGLENVINDTFSVLPIVVREAFISAQNVSFHLKDRIAKNAINDYFQEYEKVRGAQQLVRIVAKMMARLSIIWEFKEHGQFYGSDFAKVLIKHLTWKDKLTMILMSGTSKKRYHQQIFTTAAGILWNRVLRRLAAELFYESIGCGLSATEIANKFETNFKTIEKSSLSAASLHEIEKLLESEGIEAALDAEGDFDIAAMCHRGKADLMETIRSERSSISPAPSERIGM